MDMLSKSDVFCIVYLNGVELGRTEVVYDNQSPSFAKQFRMVSLLKMKQSSHHPPHGPYFHSRGRITISKKFKTFAWLFMMKTRRAAIIWMTTNCRATCASRLLNSCVDPQTHT